MQRASSIPMTQTPEEKIAALEAELRLEKERALLSQYQYETKELDYQNLLLSHSQILLAYSQTLKDKQEDDRLKFARIEQLQQDLLETQQIEVDDKTEIDSMGIELMKSRRKTADYEDHFDFLDTQIARYKINSKKLKEENLELRQTVRELTQKAAILQEQKLCLKEKIKQATEAKPTVESHKKRKLTTNYPRTFQVTHQNKAQKLAVTVDTTSQGIASRTVQWS